MIYKNLGKTKTAISAIGQGTIGAGSRANTTSEKIRKRIEVLCAGIDEGISFLDTGEDYEDGQSEEILGNAVRNMRSRVFISSKFKPANNSYAKVLQAAEMSLRRLNTDYLDLYQLQWPNPEVALSETLEAMSRLIEQGKVRFMGVSNLNCRQLRQARELTGDKLVSLQTEYSLFNRGVERNVLPYCESVGMTLMAYSPLSRGALCFDEDEKKLFERLCMKYSVTRSQVMLNWLTAHKNVTAITQTMCIDHVRENARAMDFDMHHEDAEAMSQMFQREPLPVSTERIRVINQDADETHRIYTTLEAAVANALNVQPSPAAIAEELKLGTMLRPVDLVATGDASGRYDFDLVHGRMRYWAWIIAYGNDTPIPAYVKNLEKCQ